MKNLPAFVAVLSFVSIAQGAAPLDAPREVRFADPPRAARILPIHHGRKNGTEKDIAAELDRLDAAGFGGLTCNVNWSSNYLFNAQDWHTFTNLARAAHARGMTMWLYDEFGYPSGTAADNTLKGHPEWAARGILCASTNVPGGATATLKLPPGLFRGGFACPIVLGRLDLAHGVEVPNRSRNRGEPGTVTWDAPAGRDAWRVMAFTEDFLYEGTHSSISLVRRERYINLLMREPTDRFIELTHEAYLKHLGPDGLKWFVSTFTDEPSLMSCWTSRMPYSVVPWCPDLAGDYAARTGRDLVADLPALFFEATDGSSTRIRHAFWNLVGDRVARNFAGRLTEWCSRHGILSGGHYLGEEGLGGHVAYYGDFFRSLRALSAPSVDCLQAVPEKILWLTPMFAGSAADLNGGRTVMCELSDYAERARHKTGNPLSKDEVRGNLNKLLWGGINSFPSYHSLQPFPTAAERRALNVELGRANTLLADTANAAEVALLYPADAMMAGYEPALQGGGGAGNRRAGTAFRATGESLSVSGRSFMLTDAQALAEGTVADGVLRYRDLAWRVVVLPEASVLPAKALANLQALWRTGGAVVAVGALPVHATDAFPSASFAAACREMFGADAAVGAFSRAESAAGGTGVALPRTFAAGVGAVVNRLLTPELVLEGTAPGALKVAHRRGAEGDVFFLYNDARAVWKGTVACAAEGVELWNPVDGTHGALKPLEIEPFASRVVTMRTAVRSARRAFATDGLFPVARSIAAPSRVSLVKARDVEARLEKLSDGFWRDTTTVTKSDVDTFSFINFFYGTNAVPNAAEGFVFDLRVDAPQPHTRETVVFVDLADGARFIVNTGVDMMTAGRTRVLVPFARLRPWGATSKTRTFEPAQTCSIQFGFGGNFGVAGDVITFAVSEPKVYAQEE